MLHQRQILPRGCHQKHHIGRGFGVVLDFSVAAVVLGAAIVLPSRISWLSTISTGVLQINSSNCFSDSGHSRWSLVATLYSCHWTSPEWVTFPYSCTVVAIERWNLFFESMISLKKLHTPTSSNTAPIFGNYTFFLTISLSLSPSGTKFTNMGGARMKDYI